MLVILLDQVITEEMIQALDPKYTLICEQRHLMDSELDGGIHVQKHQCPDIGQILAQALMEIFQEVSEIKP